MVPWAHESQPPNRHLDRFSHSCSATNADWDRHTHRPRYVQHLNNMPTFFRSLGSSGLERHTCWLCQLKAPSTPATMSKRQATLSKLRSTLSKQHSTLLPQTATMSNDSIVKCRPFDKVETNWTRSICFDFVERTKFRSTLLPKPATLLSKTATMSKQHSTLSKESFNL